KIIGGGFPVGAYGGKKALMEKVSPSGPVYQAGTLSGNPLAMAAGLAQLKVLDSKRDDIYAGLERSTAALCQGLSKAAEDAGVPAAVNRLGSMFTVFFTEGPVVDYRSATASNTDRFGRYFREMLDQGIYLGPSQYETAFVSAAHTREHMEETVGAARRAMKRL
ncbi:MAG: aminotransferase class III-fold pyridoxal phosphate-dependent enzyme, partial [Acidobacteriota bacterium]